MKIAAIAATLLLSMPAAAHEVQVSPHYNPAILWLDAPNITNAGDARIRMVFHGQERAAVLTPNQVWAYQNAYKRRLAHLAHHMSIHRAEPRARHHAFHAVVSAYPNVRVDAVKVAPVQGGRLTPNW